MIKTKEDLKQYLKIDKEQNARKSRFPRIVGDEIWIYLIVLRHFEYHHNNNNFFRKWFYKIWHHKLGIKLGFEIPPNTCGKGLCLAHRGPIIINKAAKIGDYSRIHSGVNIGTAAGRGGRSTTNR